MRRALASVFFALALAACATNQSDGSTDGGGASAADDGALVDTHAAEVARLIEPLIEGEWARGVVVGLLHDGQRELYGFGRAAEGDEAPNADTVFEIGSVSKVFTALLLADAVARSQLELDSPMAALLPQGVGDPSPSASPITLRHLATHTSGLPTLPANLALSSLDDPYANYSSADLYAEVPRAQLQSTPGSRYLYSNFGFGLLGHLMATRADASYAEQIREVITAPLRMTRTGQDLPSENVARGFNSEGATVPYWRFDALAGAGALRSSARDLLRLVAANLAPNNDDLGAAMRLAQREHARAPIPLGLGWHIERDRADGHPIHWHNGATGGFSSFIAVDVTRGHGVVVLANTYNTKTDATGFALLQLLRGESPTLEIPRAIEVAETTLAEYVGAYAFTPTLSVTISREGSRLYAQITGQERLRIFPESESLFFYREVDAKIAFFRNGDGQVNRLVLRQDGHSSTAHKVD